MSRGFLGLMAAGDAGGLRWGKYVYAPGLARWRLAMALWLLTATLAVAVGLAAPHGQQIHTVLVAAWITAVLLYLCAGVLLYLHWRVDHDPAAGWLALIALWAGLYALSFAVRLYVDTGSQFIVEAEGLDVLVAVLALLFFRQISVGAALPRHGLVWTGGVVLSVCVGLQVMLARYAELLPDPAVTRAITDSVIVVMGVLCLAVLMTTRQMGREVRNQLVVICFLSAASRLLVPLDVSDNDRLSLLATGLCLLAAAMLAREALFLLLRAHEEAESMALVRSCATGLEQRNAEDLHEVRASLAGVTKALEMLDGVDADLGREHRNQMIHMLLSEVTRMQRMLAHSRSRDTEIALDEALEPVIFSRRMTGQTIHWRKSGLCVFGAVDAIAEAVNILLVNADRHAHGSPVWLSASAEGGVIRLRVSDRGPGVPEHLRDEVFVSGVRGPGSTGTGLGLDMARRLLTAHGGALELGAPERGGGAAFDVVLPAPGGGHLISAGDRVTDPVADPEVDSALGDDVDSVLDSVLDSMVQHPLDPIDSAAGPVVPRPRRAAS